MVIHLALCRSREEFADQRSSIFGVNPTSAQMTLEFASVGSWAFLWCAIFDPQAYEWYRDQSARRNKLRATERKVGLAADVAKAVVADAVVHASAKKEVICARILQKRQRRNTRDLAREQARAIHAMAGLPPKRGEQ